MDMLARLMAPSSRRVFSLSAVFYIAIVAVRTIWRRAIAILGAGGTDNTPVACVAAEPTAPCLPAGLPLIELARDVIVTTLSKLSAVDLSAASVASRFLLLVASEAQRLPMLVTEVGSPQVVLSALGRRLSATPTMGFLFGTGNLEDSSISHILSERLPPGCHVIGAESAELQALVNARAVSVDGSDVGKMEGAKEASATDLRHISEPGQVAVMLGSFPDAVAHSFYLPMNVCTDIARAYDDAAALECLQRLGYPAGPEWKTIVLIVSGGRFRIDPARIVKAFQCGSRHTAIIGGIAGAQILLHARGRTHVHNQGIVGLALRGDVPLTALVSRGCIPLSPPFRSNGVWDSAVAVERGRQERTLLIRELLSEDGTLQKPLRVVVEAQRTMRERGALFAGIRVAAEGGGYLLEQLSQDNFLPDGTMSLQLSLRGDSGEGTNEQGSEGGEASVEINSSLECSIRFYKLDRDACRADLCQQLGNVRQQCEDGVDETLGAIMFTCGARGPTLFGENHVDAKQFRTVFPSLPLVGFWAGGEIGPRALAEATPAEATRTGDADLQGFTAVFGIFRVPPVSKVRALLLSDDQVPDAVGEFFTQRAREAKERGNLAFREADSVDAAVHYTRAVNLASVPSVRASAAELATLFANRAMAGLKAGRPQDALADTEAALELDPLHVKAHYRRGESLLQLERFADATACLRTACDRLPEQGVLQTLLKRAERMERTELEGAGKERTFAD